jgi:hypothetical protein
MSLAVRGLVLSLSLSLVVLACTANDVTLGGAGTIVRVDSEPAGAGCPDGGVAIHVGLDDDDDLYLDDAEIMSSQLLCTGSRPVQCSGGTIASGSVTIDGVAAWSRLDGVHCVEGDLLVTGIEEAVPALADLAVVTGDVVIVGNTHPGVLGAFGALREIGDTVLVQGNDAITDLTGLGAIERAASIVVIGNRQLASLAGLPPLVDFGGAIRVTNNPALTTLTGLDDLVTCGGQIVLRSNRALRSVAALGALREVQLLEVSGHPALTSLVLPSLERIEARVLVTDNPGLTEVALPVATTAGDFIRVEANGALTSVAAPRLLTAGGFLVVSNPVLASVTAPALTYVTGDVDLVGLPALASLDLSGLDSVGGDVLVQGLTRSPHLAGLGALDTIGGNLTIRNNTGMVDLAGLSSLVFVAGDLTLAGNTDLASVAGLDALREVGGALAITGNASLPTAAAQGFAGAIEIGSTVTISGNRQ